MKIKTYEFSKKKFFKFCEKLIDKKYNSHADKLIELEHRIIALELEQSDQQKPKDEIEINGLYWFYTDSIENGTFGILKHFENDYKNSKIYFTENNNMYLNCIPIADYYSAIRSPSS